MMNWARCFSKRVILVVQDLINKFPLLPMNAWQMNPDFRGLCDIGFGIGGGVVIRAWLKCEELYEFIY